MKRLVLENTSPFQGLAELVADKEGLFEKEGLTIEWVDREKGAAVIHVNAWITAAPYQIHGRNRVPSLRPFQIL